MRLVYKKFSDGTSELYQTDSDGRNKKVLEGETPLIGRCDVFVEVNTEGAELSDISEGIVKMRDILVSFPRGGR